MNDALFLFVRLNDNYEATAEIDLRPLFLCMHINCVRMQIHTYGSAKSFLRRLEVSLNIRGEVVSIEGLEPSPEDWNLNPARLPIPPYGRIK